MKKLAVIYHSAHGHTEHIAQHIAEGARDIPDTEVHLVRAEELTSQPNNLLEFDGLLLGSPTYLGGVSGTFKNFMDSTGGLWRTQQLKGKLAAGFTVSSLFPKKIWTCFIQPASLRNDVAPGFRDRHAAYCWPG